MRKETYLLGNIALFLFIVSLVVCIFFNIDITFALLIGFVLFFIYCLTQGFSAKKTLSIMATGLFKIKNVLLVFFMIGILTASWRMSGTIAYIIYKIVPFVNPRFFVFATFLLCSFMSMLIGTSFGTVASMGVICMVIARSMGINEMYVGGAVLSGIYLGDRNSPMSSSASLVCALTNTDLYINIKNMFKTSIIPFIVSCIIYLFIGFKNEPSNMDMSILSVFSTNYNLSVMLILPALAIIILSLLKIDVKIVMAISILIASIVGVIYQKIDIRQLLEIFIFGYKSPNLQLSKLMDGGGVLSMVKATITIIISTAYFGVFNHTPILDSIKKLIEQISKKFTRFGGMIFTGFLTSAIACNQSLATMLTYQLTKDIYDNKYKHAVDIENTAILIPSLLPWNIAVAIPMATIGVPSITIIYSFFAYIVPIYNFLLAVFKKDKSVIQEN